MSSDFNSPILPDPFSGSHGENISSDIELGAPVKRLLVKNAKVIRADLNYNGSINLPSEWFERGLVFNGELVRVFNETAFREGRHKDNPERYWMTTYAIRDPDPNFSDIMSNGGAAQRIKPGDIISIHSFINFNKDTDLDLIKNNFGSKNIFLGNDNTIKEIKFGHKRKSNIYKGIINSSYVPMYTGKLHRIIPKSIPGALRNIAAELDSSGSLRMLVDKDLGLKAGFKEGQYVDYLMVYKNVRESVEVNFTSIPGHMSFHGKTAQSLMNQSVEDDIAKQMYDPNGESADPNTTVVIGYKMMEYQEAKKYSQWISDNDYPNRVVFDGSKSKGDRNHIDISMPIFPYIPGRSPNLKDSFEVSL